MNRYQYMLRKGTAQQYKSYPNKQNYLRLLSIDPAGKNGHDLIQLFDACNKKGRCLASTCPYCGFKLKAKEEVEAWKRIIEHFGREPSPTELLPITVNGDRVDLSSEEEVQRAVKQLRDKLKKAQAKSSFAVIGWLDLSMQGLVHMHGFLLLPRRDLQEITKALTDHFPGRKAIQVGWKKKSPVQVQEASWRHYSIKVTPNLIREEIDEHTAQRFSQLIVALTVMRRAGLRSGRVRLGLTRRGKWKRDTWMHNGMSVAVPVITRLIYSKKRRSDRKWAIRQAMVMKRKIRRSSAFQACTSISTATDKEEMLRS